MKPTISKPFKSNDRTFDKVYNAFDKRDYFNSQGLAKTQIGNFERALKKNDKGAQQILDMFKGDMGKAKDYITQVISDRNKERAFNNYKAMKSAVDSFKTGKPNVGAVDYVKRIIHNSSQKYSIALYSALRNKKFTKWKDVHNDIDSLVSESVNEGKAFVVMYKVKKDLPNRNVKPSSAAYSKEADAKKFLKSIEKDGGKGMIVKSNVRGMKEGKKIIKMFNESVNEYDQWRNTRIQSKNIFKMLKQKYKNNIPKMEKGLETILKQNKTKNDQAEVVRQEFRKYFKIKESVNEASLSWEKYFKGYNEKELKVISKFIFMNPQGIDGVIKMSKHKPKEFKKTIQKAAKAGLHESVNESKSEVEQIAKKTKSETAFYDVLSKIEKKYGKRNYRIWLEKSLKDLGENPKHYDYRTNAAAEEKLYQLTK